MIKTQPPITLTLIGSTIWLMGCVLGDEMIVGVVVKIGDNIEIRMPRPNRHHHCFAHFAAVTGKNAPDIGLRTGGENQGFYTDKGKYLNRQQAFLHAKRCGQIINPDAHKYLFSEDLW